MKRFLCFLGLVLVLLPMLYAGANVKVVINPHVTFDPPSSTVQANDFHIIGFLQSKNNLMPMLVNWWANHVNGSSVWWLYHYCITQDPLNPKNWNFEAYFKTNTPISKGAIMHFGLDFITNYCNVWRVKDMYWTFNGVRIPFGSTPNVKLQPGFEITRDANNNLIATFFNDFDGEIPIEMKNLEFGVTETQVPLEEMFTTGLGDPGDIGGYGDIGWIPFAPQGGGIITISPEGGAFTINLTELGVNLAPGQFLQFRAFNNDNGVNVPWWGQHEEPTE